MTIRIVATILVLIVNAMLVHHIVLEIRLHKKFTKEIREAETKLEKLQALQSYIRPNITFRS